ncbi:MAG: hypothetical protein J6D15_02510 [Clostridia bacterium]|nr:hypothetical protein [Clostridia bacterium]
MWYNNIATKPNILIYNTKCVFFYLLVKMHALLYMLVLYVKGFVAKIRAMHFSVCGSCYTLFLFVRITLAWVCDKLQKSCLYEKNPFGKFVWAGFLQFTEGMDLFFMLPPHPSFAVQNPPSPQRRRVKNNTGAPCFWNAGIFCQRLAAATTARVVVATTAAAYEKD